MIPRGILFSALFVLSSGVVASTIRVPQDQPTIQLAIAYSATGDVILVAPGTYYENLTIDGKSVVLNSVGGAAVTSLRPADQYGRILLLTGSSNSSEISGFTFSGTNSNAIWVDGADKPRIRYCVFHHNYSEAIFITQGSPVISRNVFYQNGGNSCIGVIGGTGTTSIYNNTFDRNARGFYSLISTTKAENNIVYRSGYYGIYGSYAKLDYNDAYLNAYDYMETSPGPHDISAEPMFTDTANYDYTLMPGSPCRNAGNPDPQFNDMDGSRADIGAGPLITGTYPLAASVTLSPGVPPAVTSPAFTISWYFLDSVGRNQTGYEIEVGSDEDWSVAELWATGQVSSADTQIVYAGLPLSDGQSYLLRVRVRDVQGWGDWVGYSFFAHFTTTLRVPSVYPTIQAAIAASIAGDTVLVAPGEYTENINFIARKARLRSEAGAAATTIKAANAAVPTVQFMGGEDSLSVIDGFTVKGGQNGSSIYCSGSRPIIENCDITPVFAGGQSYGIRLVNKAAPWIRRNRIFGNAYGIYGSSYADVEISHNEIFQNTSMAGSGGIVLTNGSANVSIHHNIVRHNTGAPGNSGGILVYASNSRIFNNTVTANTTGVLFSGFLGGSIFSNIVVLNTASGLSPGGAWNDYNNVYQNGSGNAGGSHGLSADPMFVDATNFNYALMKESPCIDAGNPDTLYNDIDGTRGDMGAVFNLQAVAPFATKMIILPGDKFVVFAPIPTFYWRYFDYPVSAAGGYEIEVGLDRDWSAVELWTSGQLVSSDTSIRYGGPPLEADRRYAMRIRLFNGSNWGDWREWEFGTHFGGPWRVPVHAGKISTLMSLARSGDTIIVSPGTYTDNFAFLAKAVLVTSDSGWQTTVIQSQTSGLPVVEFKSGEGRGSILEGLSIRGARSAPGIQITNASPTIFNCEVTDNQGVYGGIAVNNGGPRIAGCRLHHNSSSNVGAGIGGAFNAATEVANNLIYDNTGTGGGGIGLSGSQSIDIHHNIIYRNGGNNASSSGIYNSFSSGTIRHNTLVSNFYGIQLYYPSNMYVFNNIVIMSFNDAIIPGNATVDYNDTWNNGRDFASSKGNMATDPLLRDTAALDFSLLPESPCIDAGDPSPVYFDPDGSRSDMGAIPRDQTGQSRVYTFSLADEVLTRVVSPYPTLWWSSIFTGGASQQAFEIQAGRDQEWSNMELWETGVIYSPDTTIVYQGYPPREGWQCYFRVRVFDGANWTAWYNLTFHMNNTPVEPTPSSPGDTSLVLVNKPTLVVSGGTDKDSDQQVITFELYRDSLLTSLRASSSPISLGTDPVLWNVPTPLLENRRYWWRSRSHDGFAHSPWSQVRSFWINELAEYPTAPAPTSPPPVGQDPVYDLSPTFAWFGGDDPDPKDSVKYTLQLSLNPSFTLSFTYADLSVKSFTLADTLPLSTHFWWRVTAIDRDEHTTGSPVAEFTTWTLGDIDHSGNPDLADLTLLIDYLFISRTPISPRKAADLDGDCHVDIADISRMISHLFLDFRPFDKGCEVSSATGAQFLQRIGAQKKLPPSSPVGSNSDIN